MTYFAHPYGGSEKNFLSATESLVRLMREYPSKTVFSPLHNWAYMPYAGDQYGILKDCWRVLARCDELVLAGRWKASAGCLAEYAWASGAGIPIYEWNGKKLRVIKEDIR